MDVSEIGPMTGCSTNKSGKYWPCAESVDTGELADISSIVEESDDSSNNDEHLIQNQSCDLAGVSSGSSTVSETSCTFNEFALPSIREVLQSWAIETHATHVSINNLLKKLRSFHSELPLDARTLLQRDKIDYQLITLDNGSFIYYGLIPTERYLSRSCDSESNHFKLFLNIDGISLSTSNNKEFLLILGRLDGQTPMILGVFCDSGKPIPVEIFGTSRKGHQFVEIGQYNKYS